MGEIKLNAKQQEAVDYIYGPLLVLAGPGTGKTQLLSSRIAKILTVTDASPQNILCLTFTENAAQNMRERLAQIIKDDAYDVHISTYHSFGSDIIRTYPQYFEEIDLETGKDTRLERPIDELQRLEIITEIISRLPYSSQLIGAKYYVKDISSTISDLKRSLFTPQSLEELAKNNLRQVQTLSPKIADHLAGVKRFPSKADQSIELFEPLLDFLDGDDGLAKTASEALEKAIEKASESGKSSPLTEWKNTWLTKDDHDHFVLTSEDQHLRMAELAKVFERYNQALEEKHLYDFDDMILRTIDALNKNDDLRFTLQEKYQFILLDEFQDTNPAQFELVKKLCDNPVNEGQPNIFAVGDDDQAIYAFQGASVSNMSEFRHVFRDVKVINLTENYRSHPDILHTAHGIAGQIESRLHHDMEGIDKTLIASKKDLPSDASIERHEFDAEANEYSWVASKIKELIKNGTKPHEIAVLAPQHKYLENLVPFLAHNNTPVSYEKRENILETPLVRMFRAMIELVIACSDNDQQLMDQLFPRVLSFDFYQLPVKTIWQINWQHYRQNELSWAELALENSDLTPHIQFYLALGMKTSSEPLEYILDYLTGTIPLAIDSENTYQSPFRNFYFAESTNTLQYYEGLANLSTIREHLRAWQAGQETLLKPQDFLHFINTYEAAEQPLINTHPIALAEDSVNLMTTYKAKGLEFEHVFLLSVHDDVWGKSARGYSNKLTLPANLQYIRYRGSDEDELRRLLFVAITRAKHGLYLTSHAHKDNGKKTEPVKYLLEFGEGSERKTSVLPVSKQIVHFDNFDQAETMQAIDTMWHSRHLQLDAPLISLLRNRLDHYLMSPTHLNTFIDTEYGGPGEFLLRTILRFPQAPGIDGEYGNAIHGALEYAQEQSKKSKVESRGLVAKAISEFDRQLSKRYIPENEMDNLRSRGHNSLKKYFEARADMFALPAESEVNFANEGVVLGVARLSGKIDRLEVDKSSKTVRIVDFKTGKPFSKWEKELKLLKYKQQLYFYKFLIEGSHTWSGYKVAGARLEFVEPDSRGKILPPLEIDFDQKEETDLIELIQKVWVMIQKLDLPDISGYTADYKGATEFIEKLIG